MTEYIRTIRLDPVTVTAINVGDFQAPYADEWSNVPPTKLSQLDSAELSGLIRMPIQCFHVALPRMSIVVDAGVYHVLRSYAIPNYQLPPGLLAGWLRRMSILAV